MSEITAHHGILHSTKLHVDDTGGPGRPVVLIHGWPLSAASWNDQIAPLAQAGYRVITYDRRGFGRSDKPGKGYDYDTLTDDLHALMEQLDCEDATLVGFSMGGGEVARYFTRFGDQRVRSVVFAAAVPPCLIRSVNNPDGPLDPAAAREMAAGLEHDEGAFYDEFITQFFTAEGALAVTDAQRSEARAMCDQADKAAAVGCMEAWATTDFRDDLPHVTVPTMVLHGDSDATVPFEGSGERTHEAIAGSQVHLIAGAPHGCNVSHADDFNRSLLNFLAG